MTQTCKILILFLSLCFTLQLQSPAKAADQYGIARKKLIRKIEIDVKQTSQHLDKFWLDSRVMDAMRSVPRHKFVPINLRHLSYENRPLPIGHGQTISQPYIVAIMTDLINVDNKSTVLEIGTGSGYQAAILAEIVKEVYTIEIIEPLGKSAKKRLNELGYANVHVRLADGYYGWQDKGPFDAIVVTAAASHIPPPLIRQLKPGGSMIIPVGGQFMVQHLVMVEKETDGSTKTRQILPVRFVPLTGKH